MPVSVFLSQEYITKNSRLENRGPDSSSYCTVDLSDGTQIMFSGYVLHLRGDDLVTQPASHSNGDILLWNAEVFGGMKVCEYIFEQSFRFSVCRK